MEKIIKKPVVTFGGRWYKGVKNFNMRSSIKKPKPIAERYDYQKTPGFRDRLHIGAALANQMPVRMRAKDCAAHFGISTQRLRQIECLALWKVQARLVEYMKSHEYEPS